MSHAAAYHLAADDPNVKAHVGDRVFQLFAPQDAPRPYVVFQRISEPRDDHTTEGHADIRSPTYQYSVYSTDPNEAKKVADAIMVAAETCRSAEVLGAFASSLSDDYEAAADGDERHIAVSHVEVELRLTA